ncbi:MAG TPA: hypothetical protein VFA89_06405 [Terriglobales bacterium]|nr:hypothetical protein [Terriglobales bacterium]
MTGKSNISQRDHWSELYRKALFEEDHEKLRPLLDRAHQAIQKRTRELWYAKGELNTSGVTLRERRELDTAAYFLGLLRSLGDSGSLQ